MNSTVGLRRRGGLGKRFGLAPVVALLLVAVLGAGFLFVRTLASTDDPDANSSFGAAEVSALTPAEAIERFQELRSLLARTYRAHDVSLIRLWMAPDAPSKEQVLDDVARLQRDGVSDRTKRQSQSLEITARTSTEIRLLEVIVEKPHFVAESTGKNVTGKADPERQSITWIMRPYSHEWLLYRQLIESAEPVRG